MFDESTKKEGAITSEQNICRKRETNGERAGLVNLIGTTKRVVEHDPALDTSDLSCSLTVFSKHIIDDPAVDAGGGR